jgi:hypothetical protein
MPSNDADYGRDYYQRNREHILERSRNKIANRERDEKIRQYQQDYFKEKIEAKKAYMHEYRKEHHEELAEKRRDAYRASILEEVGRIVVPTCKKIDATGIEIRTQKRFETIGNMMHKRHLIERHLEVNRLKAEAFKNTLSAESICPHQTTSNSMNKPNEQPTKNTQSPPLTNPVL